MNGADIAVLAVIGLVLIGAVVAVVWHKRRGRKCIGCPDSGGCGGNCSGCGTK